MWMIAQTFCFEFANSDSHGARLVVKHLVKTGATILPFVLDVWRSTDFVCIESSVERSQPPGRKLGPATDL